MTEQDNFRDAATHALAGFQLIEAGLKDYIADYHDRVRASIPGNLTYENSGKDIEEAALGRLVEIFDKANSNKPLVGKLRKLKKQRDELAHRALVNLYGERQEGFDFLGQAKLLIELAQEIGTLLNEILREHALISSVSRNPA